jgi:hypothetical protein
MSANFHFAPIFILQKVSANFSLKQFCREVWGDSPHYQHKYFTLLINDQFLLNYLKEMLFLLLFFSAVLASKKPISSFSLETNLREHITYILTEAAAKIF